MRVQTRRTITTIALLLSALWFAPGSIFAEVIDRIVATVNGRVILQSDWDEGLCYEALLNHRDLSQFSAEERRAVLDRLIDQELLREQMKASDFHHASDVEVSARLVDARKQYPEAGSPEGWQTLIARYHLTEKDLLDHIRREIDLTRLVDARLRPAVEIDAKSVEAYYRDQFVPKLRQAGGSEVSLAEVSSKIRELLTQEKVSELLVSWLHTLRSEGEVRLPGGMRPGSDGDAGVQSQ